MVDGKKKRYDLAELLTVDGGQLMENSQSSPLRGVRGVFFWLKEEGGGRMVDGHPSTVNRQPSTVNLSVPEIC